jgi:hypothetical protein
MAEPASEPQPEECLDAAGCVYIIGDDGLRQTCGEPLQAGSPYCPRHHALCYIRCGSRAEVAGLREVETLASAVGGRRCRAAEGPSERFLRRLEHAVRDFARAHRSCYVREV